jgi:propionyl-CoA carboxylase alpha chain
VPRRVSHVLFAAQDGIVKSVVAAKGESLSVDQVIVEFES